MASRAKRRSGSETHPAVKLALAVLGGGLLRAVGRSAAEAEARRLQNFVVRLYLRASRVIGIAPPQLEFTTAVYNAASDGVRILVSPDWLVRLLRQFCALPECSEAIVLGVLAHELAHHIHGDAFASGWERIDRELRADYIAGRVLAKVGVASVDLEQVLIEMSSSCSISHPSGPDRVLAIQAGYADGTAIDSQSYSMGIDAYLS